MEKCLKCHCNNIVVLIFHFKLSLGVNIHPSIFQTNVPNLISSEELENMSIGSLTAFIRSFPGEELHTCLLRFRKRLSQDNRYIEHSVDLFRFRTVEFGCQAVHLQTSNTSRCPEWKAGSGGLTFEL